MRTREREKEAVRYREMGVMNKMLLVVALLMAVVVSAMAVFPAPPEGCVEIKCRKST